MHVRAFNTGLVTSGALYRKEEGLKHFPPALEKKGGPAAGFVDIISEIYYIFCSILPGPGRGPGRKMWREREYRKNEEIC